MSDIGLGDRVLWQGHPGNVTKISSDGRMQVDLVFPVVLEIGTLSGQRVRRIVTLPTELEVVSPIPEPPEDPALAADTDCCQ